MIRKLPVYEFRFRVLFGKNIMGIKKAWRIAMITLISSVNAWGSPVANIMACTGSGANINSALRVLDLLQGILSSGNFLSLTMTITIQSNAMMDRGITTEDKEM